MSFCVFMHVLVLMVRVLESQKKKMSRKETPSNHCPTWTAVKRHHHIIHNSSFAFN
jgi:hypothetical protein